jgi:hypothetical protein
MEFREKKFRRMARDEITKFRMFFSLTKWFGTEFRAFLFSPEWIGISQNGSERNFERFSNSRNSFGMNQKFRLFRVPRNNFFSENDNSIMGFRKI